MKKVLLTLVTLCMAATMSPQTDTIVSTNVTNKNAILEEYTGVNCGYCPDGHRIANGIAAANPGRFFAINIHTGDFAPQYTTAFGSALANQTGLTGYPAGTVNRHVFSGSYTTLNRGNWSGAVDMILAQEAPVNVAARCTIDYATRLMTVTVQAYYTGATTSSNMLNVAVVQNNILGPQSGMSTNPGQVVGNQYNHMHMLRHMITGQWGDQITETATGTFVERTYTWQIPATIGNNGSTDPSATCPVAVMPEDLEVICFVTEGHQEILNGCEAEMTIVNGAVNIYNVAAHPQVSCTPQIGAIAQITNPTEDAVSSLEITYTLNGASHTHTANVNIPAFGKVDVELPYITEGITAGTNYTVDCQITKVNGETFSGNHSELTTAFSAAKDVDGRLFVTLTCDKYGSETSWAFKDMAGNVIQHGGPYANANNTKKYYFALVPPSTGCYVFEVYDEYGDGINSGYGAGSIKCEDRHGLIDNNNGKFGDKYQLFMNMTAYADYSDIEATESVEAVSVYPNPANDVLNIASSENVSMVEVFNLQGQRLLAQNEASQINISNLTTGTYMVRLTTANGVVLKKFVKE